VKQYLERAKNELRVAIILNNISQDEEEKIKLGCIEGDTFYSSVISPAYYSIFYSAKAILLTRGVITDFP
jgi:hypothetical protein